MLHGRLRPGYDYLLDRKLTVILREAAVSPLGPDLKRFLAGAEVLGYSVRARTGMASEVAVRVLIQTGRPLAELTDTDFTAFGQAITERETRLGRELKHYHHALYASRAVIYHLGAPAEPVPKRSTLGRWSWERHLDGVPPQVRRPMVAYLERLQGTHARSSVQGTASELVYFGRFLARHDPELPSLSGLGRQRHIEPYLNEVAVAVNHRTGQPVAASTAKQRIQSVGIFLDAIAEWGWPEAPARRLIFPRDAPKLPHPLPRYLPPDQERALLAALEASPNRLYADALLLLRATGMRIGELTDLELDCVHEVPGSGAWLKIPLGKLLTERMVPIDEETVELVDRIIRR
jgi:integrase